MQHMKNYESTINYLYPIAWKYAYSGIFSKWTEEGNLIQKT